MNINAKIVSSLVKVFLDEEPPASDDTKLSGFMNETVSFQISFIIADEVVRDFIRIETVSPIADSVKLRRVNHVPVRFTTQLNADDNYLRDKKPGLYPALCQYIT